MAGDYVSGSKPDALVPVNVDGREVGWVIRSFEGFSFVLLDERDADSREYASAGEAIDAAEHTHRCLTSMDRMLMMLDT